MREKIDSYIEAHKEEMIASLQEAVRIPSVQGEPTIGAPYGIEAKRMLDWTLEMSRQLGFHTVVNVDDQCGYAEFGEGEELIGVFAHFDVVPEGIGWTYPPYSGEIHDGWIYGRGVVDDKGPGIACVYGMKAIMDLGLPIRRRIRMVFGINEENGMKDIQYYMRKCGAPTAGFSPDAQFPVSFAEKSGTQVHVGKKLNGQAVKGLQLLEMQGGITHTRIPDHCTAVLLAQDESQAVWVMERLSMFAEKTGWQLTGQRHACKITIQSDGRTGHPYTPRLAQNAISQLIMFLDRIDVQGEAGEIIRILRQKIGMEYFGESLGIDHEDESGFLTFSNTIIHLDEQNFSAVFSMYRPYYYEMQDLVADIERALSPVGIKVTSSNCSPGVMRDKNAPVIRKLAQVYGDYTGMDTTPRAVGGTYSKWIPTIQGFGAIFPGTKDMCHVVDESVKVDEFILLGKIYGSAIYELATMDL